MISQQQRPQKQQQQSDNGHTYANIAKHSTTLRMSETIYPLLSGSGILPARTNPPFSASASLESWFSASMIGVYCQRPINRITRCNFQLSDYIVSQPLGMQIIYRLRKIKNNPGNTINQPRQAAELQNTNPHRIHFILQGVGIKPRKR